MLIQIVDYLEDLESRHDEVDWAQFKQMSYSFVSTTWLSKAIWTPIFSSLIDLSISSSSFWNLLISDNWLLTLETMLRRIIFQIVAINNTILAITVVIR